MQRDHGDPRAEEEGLEADRHDVERLDGLADLRQEVLQGQGRQRPGDGVPPQHGDDAEDGDQADEGHRDADHAGHEQDVEGVHALEFQGLDLAQNRHVSRLDRHRRGGPEDDHQGGDQGTELTDEQGDGDLPEVVLGGDARELQDHHAAEKQRDGDDDPQGLDGREVDLFDDDPQPQAAAGPGVDDDLAQDPVEERGLVCVSVQPVHGLPAQIPRVVPHRIGLPVVPAPLVSTQKTLDETPGFVNPEVSGRRRPQRAGRSAPVAGTGNRAAGKARRPGAAAPKKRPGEPGLPLPPQGSRMYLTTRSPTSRVP